LPKTYATPELRVDCPDEKKFDVVRQAAADFKKKYPVFTLDGVRITFPADGVCCAPEHAAGAGDAFEATSPKDLAAVSRRGRRLAGGARRDGVTV